MHSVTIVLKNSLLMKINYLFNYNCINLPNQNLSNITMTQIALMLIVVMNYNFHKEETFFVLTCHH
jgi:hypothetical protein